MADPVNFLDVGVRAAAVVAASGTAQTIDFEDGSFFDITLTGNVTLTFANVPTQSGRPFEAVFLFRQDGTGSRTVTWPAAVKDEPTLTTTASRGDVVSIFTLDAGTTWVVKSTNLDISFA